MSRKWAIIIILSVVTIVFWSGWEVFKAVEKEKDVQEYSKYAASIPKELNTALIRKVSSMQSEVLVKDEDIAPKE